MAVWMAVPIQLIRAFLADQGNPMSAEQYNEEGRSQRYKRQTTEQFATLGRFVQEFEQAVDRIRWELRLYLNAHGRHQQRINIVLHHSALGAKALFDIFRALVVDFVQTDDVKDETEIELARNLLRGLASEFEDLVKIRNNMLHGTWYIGWASPADEDFSVIKGRKGHVTSDGMKFAPLPASAEELEVLAKKCQRLQDVFSVLGKCTINHGEDPRDTKRLSRNFRKEGSVWIRFTNPIHNSSS